MMMCHPAVGEEENHRDDPDVPRNMLRCALSDAYPKLASQDDQSLRVPDLMYSHLLCPS